MAWQDVLVGQCQVVGEQLAPGQGAELRGRQPTMLVTLLPTQVHLFRSAGLWYLVLQKGTFILALPT